MIRPLRQHGLTLIEVLVAMVIGLVIVLAAVASLTVARTGFTAVDAASQLRDSSRFASDLIQRIGVQTGYRDVFAAIRLGVVDKNAPSKPASIGGFNNLLINDTDPTAEGSARSSSNVGFGSDVLILRYQASQLYTTVTTNPTKATIADQSMIDCAGNAVASVVDPVTAAPADDSRIVSIFHVAISQGEPSLMCTYSPNGSAPWTTVPVIQGVENFQVLFGTDGVIAKTAPLPMTQVPDVPDRYLRADQIKVAGSATATQDNWRRVRSIRIGLVLRAAAGSAQGNTPQTFHPFGEAASSGAIGTAAGSAFANAVDDPGTDFSPKPDTRLRQAVTFTVHLRNDQGL